MLLAAQTLRKKYLLLAFVNLMEHALLVKRFQDNDMSAVLHHWKRVMGKRIQRWKGFGLCRRLLNDMEERAEGWSIAFSKLRTVDKWIAMALERGKSQMLITTSSLAMKELVKRRFLRRWRLYTLAKVREGTGTRLAMEKRRKAMIKESWNTYVCWVKKVKLENQLISRYWRRRRLQQGLQR